MSFEYGQLRQSLKSLELPQADYLPTSRPHHQGFDGRSSTRTRHSIQSRQRTRHSASGQKRHGLLVTFSEA